MSDKKTLPGFARQSAVSGKKNRRPGRGMPSPGAAAFFLCCLVLILVFALRSDRGFMRTTDPLVEAEEYTPAAGEVVSQTLPDGKKTIRDLQVKFGTSGRVNEGLVTVAFLKNGEEVRQWKLDSDLVTDQEYRKFVFDRPLSIKADDHCAFTVSQAFEGENAVSVRLAENAAGGSGEDGFEESDRGEDGSEDSDYEESGYEEDGSEENGSEENYMEEDGSEGAEDEKGAGQSLPEDRTVSFRLTLVDGSMRARCLPLLVIILVILSAAAAALIDFRRAGVLKLVLTAFALFLFLEVFTTDLMSRMVTEIPVRAYTWKGATEKIGPGEEWEELLSLRRTDFSTLRIPVSKGEGQSSSIYVQLTNEESGQVYFDREISNADMTGGGPTGKAIRISALENSGGEGSENGDPSATQKSGKNVFPCGTYRLLIRNADDSDSLRISVQDDGRGEQTINYQAVLDSGLGYRIASVVLLLAGLYLIAVFSGLADRGIAGILGRTAASRSAGNSNGFGRTGASRSESPAGAPALRFFMISVIPLSIIYLILLLPWSAPDSGSHIMAVNRFTNILTGAGQDHEWDARADDAVLFPTEEERRLERNPQMKDYAETYLGGRTGAQDRTLTQIGSDEKMVFYSPVNYLPQILGFTLARLLGLGTVPMFFLARILTLIVYIAACAHAVRTTPVGRSIFAAIGLLPVSLMIGSSISYDMMVLISTLCFTASVLRAAEEGGGITRNQASSGRKNAAASRDNIGDRQRTGMAVIESAVWAAVIGSVKGGGYLLLLPLVLLLLPRAGKETAYQGAGSRENGFQKTGSREMISDDPYALGASSGKLSGSLAESLRGDPADPVRPGRPAHPAMRTGDTLKRILPILLAGAIFALIFDVILPAGSLFQFGGDINGKMAFSYALTHPAAYLAMMMKAYITNADSLVFGIAGSRLAFAEPTIPDLVIAGLLLCTGAMALAEKDRLSLTRRDKTIFQIIIAVLVLTMPAMLLSWTNEGSDMIMGLQGRYYLPVLPLILLACTKPSLYGKTAGRQDPDQTARRQTDRSFIRAFCLLSCLCVYYMMRLYLTR